MMKVVYFNYLYDIKDSAVGSSVHVEEFAAAFRKLGNEVKVFYQNQYDDSKNPAKYKLREYFKKRFSKGLNQIHGLMNNFKYFVREYRIIQAERPDVILTRYDLLNFSSVFLARMKKIPLVLEINAPHAYESRQFYRHSFHWPFISEFIEKMNAKIVDAVVVVSKELREYFLRQGISKKKIFIVPNGVDEKKFSPRAKDGEILSKFNLHDAIVLGFVGSFHFWHGIENLIYLIRKILLRYRNVRFLLVGGGNLKRELEEFVRLNQLETRVILPGYVSHEQIPKHLSVMDVVLAPYPKHDFFYFSPLKLFEYMAASKAVVAARIGQIKEVIKDGYNGLLFDPDNREEMLERTFELIDDEQLRSSIGQRARETVLSKYTWELNAKKISDICHRLI